jgi:hypothetical protein
MNPGLGLSKRQARPKKPKPVTKVAGTGNGQAVQEDEEDDGQQDEEEDAEGGPDEELLAGTTPGSTNSTAARKALDTIQILELQSQNPVIAYKGHVFSCNWAENIGTELLFAAHDTQNPLPALRTLPNNLDILAASSARLVSNTVTLEPKGNLDYELIASARKVMSRAKRRGLVPVIKVDKNASDARKNQASFLEKVMIAKQNRGEKDEVSVYLERRQTNQMWLDHVEEKRDEKRAELTHLMKKGGRRGDIAAKELKEMDEEDAASGKPHIPKRGIKRKGVGRGRVGPRARGRLKRTPGAGRPALSESEEAEESEEGSEEEDGEVDVDGEGDEHAFGPQGRLSSLLDTWTQNRVLSTSTPKSWSELELHDEDAEGEPYDEDEIMEG